MTQRVIFSDRQLADMVIGLIGEVEPVGETREDDKRFDNLLRLQNTVDILLDEIYYCCGYADNVEYSMKRSAETAIAWMEEKREWLNEILGTEWIPCSERLPDEKEDTYWVCTNSGYQCECRWTNDRWGFGESDTWGWKPIDIPQYTKVVAWMSLPEPWKGADDET